MPRCAVNKIESLPGNELLTVSDRRLPQCSATVVTGHNAYVISATDYSAFGAPLPDRTWNADGYRFGFNGKENDYETYGVGNIYDYGFRIYDPRKAKFLSVDPLTKSYPWYTPYQFAGNKPIIAIDLDGLEEKIVIYSMTSGKVMTTTIDYNKLIMSTHISGGYAMNKKISRQEFMAYKDSYFKGFADNKDMFASGHQKYTLGISGQNKAGFKGTSKGTLTIAAVTDKVSVNYDPTPVQEKKESSCSIVYRNLASPDSRTKAAIASGTAYIVGVGMVLGVSEIAVTGATIWNVPSVVGDAYQLVTIATNSEAPLQAEVAGNTIDAIDFTRSLSKLAKGHLEEMPNLIQGLYSLSSDAVQSAEKKEAKKNDKK